MNTAMETRIFRGWGGTGDLEHHGRLAALHGQLEANEPELRGAARPHNASRQHARGTHRARRGGVHKRPEAPLPLTINCSGSAAGLLLLLLLLLLLFLILPPPLPYPQHAQLRQPLPVLVSAPAPSSAPPPTAPPPTPTLPPLALGSFPHACAAVALPHDDPAAGALPPSVAVVVAGAHWEAGGASPPALLERLRARVLAPLAAQRPPGGLALILCTPPGAAASAVAAALAAAAAARALPGVTALHACVGTQLRTALPLHARAAACLRALPPRASPSHWDWLLLLRPDLHLFAPAPHLAALSPLAVHARLRAVWQQAGGAPGQGLGGPLPLPLPPLTGAHFAFLWGTPRCWEDRLPRGSSTIMLFDDQLGVVPRAWVGLLAGLPAALQAAEARGCWPHPLLAGAPFNTTGDWGEVHFTRAVVCGGGALQPLAWEARLEKFAGYGPCYDAPCAGEVKNCSLG